MKRLNLIGRMRLIEEKAAVVEEAAQAWAGQADATWKRRARANLLAAAIEYATAAKRYLGGLGP